jgi:hypothetical protein
MQNKPEKCRRVNRLMESAIDIAISYQDAVGYPSAKIYLMEQGVSTTIIQRVLARPGQRRAATRTPPLLMPP